MTDEQFVRDAWERAELCPCPYNGRFNTSLGGRGFTRSNPGECDTKAEAWSAARAFTESRLEEIRQLREEITEGEFVSRNFIGDRGDCWKRIRNRLEAALADKLRGMKESK